jgi:hypothetical protein
LTNDYDSIKLRSHFGNDRNPDVACSVFSPFLFFYLEVFMRFWCATSLAAALLVGLSLSPAFAGDEATDDMKVVKFAIKGAT